MNRSIRSGVERRTSALFAQPRVQVSQSPAGVQYVSSAQVLGRYPRCLGEYLQQWAHAAPERPFLLERSGGASWRSVSYSAALEATQRIAGWLLTQGAGPERPVAILSENSIEHGLLTLAAMHIGAPAMPISPAYSLQSRDFAKLKGIIEHTPPAVIYVGDYHHYSAALAAITPLHSATLLIGSGSRECPPAACRFDRMPDSANQADVASAYACVNGDTIAKILYTSGSTDTPKGVINTQRMLCSNQQAKFQGWPFLTATPPVIVDWLPWNHTFGGNHNFNLVLRNGGTLHVDAGRPASPNLFAHTVHNLRDISPTVYFNVPRGYEMLVAALRSDEALRTRFFARLQVIFYAAASLPPHLWNALKELSIAAVGEPIAMTSGWGSTETAPLATDCHFDTASAAVIGLPVPGCELKLLPNGSKLEVRVRGPLVTPGYWRRPDLTEQCFDEEGFYLTGDAVRFLDPQRPECGLVFDGRVAEDFKLVTGTWVNVGALRLRGLVALASVAQDIVITGHDRDDIGFLIFPNLSACRAHCSGLPADATIDQVLANEDVRARVAAALRELERESPASSAHATRAWLLAEPPSIDAGEITDKGYINQRAVLTRRQVLVEALYAPDEQRVIKLAKTP